MPCLHFNRVKISLFLAERVINTKIAPRKLTSKKILVLSRDLPPHPPTLRSVFLTHSRTHKSPGDLF